MIDEKNKRKLLDFAVRSAEEAGKLTLEYFRGSFDVERKEDKTPVTVADKRAGRMIRDTIESTYPDHSILGEEYDDKMTDSPIRWIIDPIDGTQSFVRGVPLYAVLIAVQYEEQPLLGVIHVPPLHETVAAAIGIGCFHDGEACQVSNTDSLADAWVQVTDVVSLARHRPVLFDKLSAKAGFLRTWGDAYGYLLVATGRSDVMLDPVMELWDIAPLMPIITEAGGHFGDLDGNQIGFGKSALACAPKLWKEFLELT
ncbi:MAG: histidinol phosphate phosphatase [Candidatus Thorarchaeota archaeon]|nr:histidinol phosphate phosphatase [Candidatus Thorarchaeota archaeon]